MFPQLNHKPMIPDPHREISPSPKQHLVATWLLASCHLGEASWVLRKPRIHAFEVCPQTDPRGRWDPPPTAYAIGEGISERGCQAEKLKGGASPYSSSQENKKDPFPSTSWQVGACLPPVWTSSPKRNSESISPSPATAQPGQKFTFGGGGTRGTAASQP